MAGKKKIITDSMREAEAVIQNRLRSRIARFDPTTAEGKQKTREALYRAALLIQNAAKANIIQKRITDTGALVNSIGHKIEETAEGQISVTVGSFGIRYAAINEFGGIVTPAMRRAMFAAMRERGVLGKRPSKNVIQNGVWIPRPYLSPAFHRNRAAVIDEIRKTFDG